MSALSRAATRTQGLTSPSAQRSSDRLGPTLLLVSVVLALVPVGLSLVPGTPLHQSPGGNGSDVIRSGSSPWSSVSHLRRALRDQLQRMPVLPSSYQVTGSLVLPAADPSGTPAPETPAPETPTDTSSPTPTATPTPAPTVTVTTTERETISAPATSYVERPADSPPTDWERERDEALVVTCGLLVLLAGCYVVGSWGSDD